MKRISSLNLKNLKHGEMEEQDKKTSALITNSNQHDNDQ
jgi:hypothetical protein